MRSYYYNMQNVLKSSTQKHLQLPAILTSNAVQQIIKGKSGLSGHVFWMKDSRLVKKTMLGMTECNDMRGRPKREWLDDIQEWCGKRVVDICRDALNRTKWRSA